MPEYFRKPKKIIAFQLTEDGKHFAEIEEYFKVRVRTDLAKFNYKGNRAGYIVQSIEVFEYFDFTDWIVDNQDGELFEIVSDTNFRTEFEVESNEPEFKLQNIS